MSIRLPITTLTLLDEASSRHGVSRHRVMEAVLRLAARDPDGIVRQALSEVPGKRELSAIISRVGRKV